MKRSGDATLSQLGAMFESRQRGGTLDYGDFHSPALDSGFVAVRRAPDSTRAAAWSRVQAGLAVIGNQHVALGAGAATIASDADAVGAADALWRIEDEHGPDFAAAAPVDAAIVGIVDQLEYVE